MKWQRSGLRAAMLIVTMAWAACEPRPTEPAAPSDLFILQWLVQGSTEEILLAKSADSPRLDGDCGGALCPAGVDGDLLEVLLSDPFISIPAPLGESWADTVQLSVPGSGTVTEIVTWTVTAADTTIEAAGTRFDHCLEIVRQSNQEYGDASFFFAPDVGIVAVDRRDNRFLRKATLKGSDIRGNQTRDGVLYGSDYFPLAVGNRWVFELRGESESIEQSYGVR